MDEPILYWCEEFLNAEFEYEPVIEDGILARGEKMLLTGPSESGKSYLVLQMALEMATAGSFFGRKIPRAFRVLLVQAEVLEGEYQKRTSKLAQSYLDLPERMLAIVTTETTKFNDATGFRTMAQLVDDAQPDVLIIDPLRAFFIGDENKSEVGDDFFTAVRTLQDTVCPFTFIAVHHVRKPGMDWLQEGGKYDARGSGIWTDRPSTHLGLSVNTAQTQWKLVYHKTRGRQTRPTEQALTVDWETGLFEAGDYDTFGTGPELIRTTLGGRSEVGLEDLIEELISVHDVSRRTAYRWISDAERCGDIDRVRDPTHKSRKFVRRRET